PRDGKVALYRRERISLLADPPEPTDELRSDPVRAALLAHLEGRGASFLVALQAAVPSAPAAEVVAALWDLVWSGLVTNDTFQPLRGLRAKRKTPGRVTAAGGRWSLVRDLFLGRPDDTARAHARASMVLERYGVASGAAARAEGLAGGFGSIYPVLKVMEDAGRARRGWFVDGIDGAQFALPGTVDRLRTHRGDDQEVTVLDAADPASPWGAVVPWGARDGAGPRRVPGATLASVAGRPTLYVEKGERSWLVLTPDPIAVRAAILGWLGRKVDSWKTVRIERIDGAPALDSAMCSVFLECGFLATAGHLERVRR
ncbi:MAG: DEAD/DEAH box helicase, partial [Myxococcota bacterium]